jgi:hypothetical protein
MGGNKKLGKIQSSFVQSFTIWWDFPVTNKKKKETGRLWKHPHSHSSLSEMPLGAVASRHVERCSGDSYHFLMEKQFNLVPHHHLGT